jgi:hypothetical protein
MKSEKKSNEKIVKKKTIKKDTEIKNVTNENTPIEITVEKKIYGEVPEKYHFFLSDGKKLKSIYELIEALDEMSDEVFHYHVNEEKNDFANWIKDVMSEETLAKEIHKVENKIEAQLKMLKHVVREFAK